MKAPILFCALFATITCAAQWSTDPANPMVVSSAPNAQRFMRAIADADSGYYVFWSDLRADPAKGELYGQHFDDDGNALWTANGQLLVSHPTRSINEMAPLLMPDGSVMVCYASSTNIYTGDTVRAMRFDADANMLWTEPAVLLTAGNFMFPQVIPSGTCAYLLAYCECGAGSYRIQRVRMDGTVQFPMPGIEVGSGYWGPFTIRPDGAGGMIHTFRCGNGAGTCLKAERLDSLGATVWPGYISVADVDGLNYAFCTAAEEGGGQVDVWEVNGDLRMDRIDTLGDPIWSPAVLPTCDLPSYGQASPAALVMNDELFVAWGDNRPPAANQDLYLQKFDLSTGAELWTADGVPVIQQPSYIPTARLVASDSGAVIGIMDCNSSYAAMRVRADGSLAWPGAVSFATANTPFYDDRTELPDGSGGVVAFWESSLGDVYGARIYRNGVLYDDVGIGEQANTPGFEMYPNPARDHIGLRTNDGATITSVHVMAPDGRIMFTLDKVNAASCSIPVQQWALGTYLVRVATGKGIHVERVVKE